MGNKNASAEEHIFDISLFTGFLNSITVFTLPLGLMDCFWYIEKDEPNLKTMYNHVRMAVFIYLLENIMIHTYLEVGKYLLKVYPFESATNVPRVCDKDV
ncbi:hypothetical protein ACJX0J_012961 [Zea mays]